MDFVRNFSSINKGDVATAGGKGASLGEMSQAGLPVPPGFVILASAFDRFLAEAHLNAEIQAALDVVRQDEVQSIENASEKIQAMMGYKGIPADIAEEIIESFKELDCLLVAVRSSATSEDAADAAWAGQLETFLNTSEGNLLENIGRAWASLFTPRAIFYRLEKGLAAKQISVAVVVQEMVASEISGIAFSVHPVTQDRNQMIIEAAPGLGDGIVSGRVTPDSYVLSKEPLKVLDKTIVTAEPILSEAQILELSDLVIKIETHYGFPCDIEWALARGKFYILQSRPITTLADMLP